MKRTLLFMAGLMLATASARADYQKGNQSLQFSFGPVGYSDDVKVNNGDDTLKDCGGVGGIQYLYYIHSGPTIAIGPDILWSDLSEQDSSSILSNSASHAAGHTAIYQGVMKLAYPRGHFRPYFLGGMGAFRSSVQGDITPPSGVPVHTFDSIQYGFAGTWGLGFDVFPREHWFLGLELRQAVLSRLLHAPTQAGQSLGIQPVRDPGSITAVTLKIGYKFGAN
jgi:hypothetical protein